jgi:ABC-2 type transport system permease protein
VTTLAAPLVPIRRLRAATFADVVRSEWTKLRTVPSTMWTLLVALTLGIGLSALISLLSAQAYDGTSQVVQDDWDPTAISTSGGALAQLAIAVLGTMAITSEYATRSIRTSLAAVPRRGRLLGAKALVVAVVSLLAGELMAFGGFLSGQALIAGRAPTASLGDPGVFRAVAGVGLYVAAIALLGMALGTLLRSTAGAITTLVAVIYVLPGLAAVLPAGARDPIEKYWPTQAGQQITNVVQGGNALGPWTGFADMCLAIALTVVVAYVGLARRDA